MTDFPIAQEAKAGVAGSGRSSSAGDGVRLHLFLVNSMALVWRSTTRGRLAWFGS